MDDLTITVPSSAVMESIRDYCNFHSISHTITVGPGYGNAWDITFKEVKDVNLIRQKFLVKA